MVMDLAAISVYKTLFFANRGKNTIQQISDGNNCTAVANATRCAISASQAIVPIFAVSDCLAKSAANPTVKSLANGISHSNLQNIAYSMTSNTTASALNNIASITKFLSKLGLVGNISYAVAKCIDAKEEEKGVTFMKSAGNFAGMYLFENIYSKCIQKIKPDTITNGAKELAKNASKITFLKSIKPTSILIGIGFVAASLLGCLAGEKVGESVHSAFSSPSDNKVDCIA